MFYRFIYKLFTAMDGNMKQVRLNASSVARDPGLNNGRAYFRNPFAHKAHAEAFDKRFPNERSTCNDHKAVSDVSTSRLAPRSAILVNWMSVGCWPKWSMSHRKHCLHSLVRSLNKISMTYWISSISRPWVISWRGEISLSTIVPALSFFRRSSSSLASSRRALL